MITKYFTLFSIYILLLTQVTDVKAVEVFNNNYSGLIVKTPDDEVRFIDKNSTIRILDSENTLQNQQEELTGVVSMALPLSDISEYYAVKNNGDVWYSKDGKIVKQNISGVKDIALSDAGYHLGLKKDGVVSKWGGSYMTEPINELNNVKCIDANFFTYYALKNDGTVWEWGRIIKELRDPKIADTEMFNFEKVPSPRKVQGIENIVQISTQSSHALALNVTGEVYGWGYLDYNKLQITPKKFDGISDIVQIQSNFYKIYFLDKYGSITSIQLGDPHGPIKLDYHKKIKLLFQCDAERGVGLALTEDNNLISISYDNVVTEISLEGVDLATPFDYDIKVILNELPLIFDVEPIIRNDRTLVPLRVISEAMKMDVSWEDSIKEVTLKNDDKNIKLRIGSNKLLVNNEQHKIDVTPIIKDGRTMIPLRFISETLGAKVDWDDETRTVFISE